MTYFFIKIAPYLPKLKSAAKVVKKMYMCKKNTFLLP